MAEDAAVKADSRREPVPRQLPATVTDFTGRAAELRALTRMLDKAGAGQPGTVIISAIGGTAGVGKTALALHWAHQVADRFPDGQLHVNLRGFDPSGAPATPAEAIRRFLDALGVLPEHVPADPEAQAALYRSMLADRRMLIMLDNARDEQQVRALLPASPASLILVTSRNQLAGLAAHGAQVVSLDVLSHPEAVQLLTARLGHARAAAEPEAIDEIADLCACLPLALAVAAARAAARPGFPLAAVTTELLETGGRLNALDAGDPAANVRSVFSWSYQQLSPGTARMFRLLGLHSGPDFSVPAAASLAAVDEPEARRLLRDLARDCLITEHAPGRYAFHDLLRAYAAGQARDRDRESDRDAAIGRVLDHYLHTAWNATVGLNPSREEITLAPPGPGAAPEQLADHRQAVAWFEAELPVLLAAVSLAAESGFGGHAWQLPWTISWFMSIRGHFQEWVVIQRTALAAATRFGDTLGQAVSSRLLAHAYSRIDDFDRALDHFADALALYQRLSDRTGEALVHRNLGALAERQGRYADGLDHSEQALCLYRAVGNKAGEADMLANVGWLNACLGDYEQARAACRQALALSAELGDVSIESTVWDSLGYVEQQLGNFAEAIVCYERALVFFREMGHRVSEAISLTHLGDARSAAGELPLARRAWQQALAILVEMDNPDADEVRAKLAGIDG